MDTSLRVPIQKRRLSIHLFMNYLIHGIGLIIIAQNMQNLSDDWNTPIKTVSFVISGVGMGRLLSYLLTGYLADRLSRKLFIYIGMGCYLIFSLGMVTTPPIYVAYGCAILAGIANASLDAGTYTTLVEINNGNGWSTVFLKAFMSLGEFILPLFIAFLASSGAWYGWSFLFMAALIVINAVLLIPVKFPNIHYEKKDVAKKENTRSWRKNIATVALALYGYTSMAFMIWYTQWVTLFTKTDLGFSVTNAQFVISLYSVGSITGVMVLFLLLKRDMRELPLILTLNIIATLALGTILSSNDIFVIDIASFIFGFSAAGGIMQTGLTLFMKLYPAHRGMITGVYYFFGAIASLTVPLISGHFSTISARAAIEGDFVVGIIGIALGVIVALLSKQKMWTGSGQV